jgi:NADPH:quinone reductase-like Zn-dependent oxidoreductase
MEEFESSMYGTIIRKYGSSNVLEFHKKLTTKPLVKEFNSTSTKVLIKVHATSVNPLDCRIRKGDYFNSYYPALPHILGKDASGVVVAVGKGVSKFSIGDEVCGFLPQFTPSTGTYSQYTCFEQSQLIKKPENISHFEAASLTLSGSAGKQNFKKFKFSKLITV